MSAPSGADQKENVEEVDGEEVVGAPAAPKEVVGAPAAAKEVNGAPAAPKQDTTNKEKTEKQNDSKTDGESKQQVEHAPKETTTESKTAKETENAAESVPEVDKAALREAFGSFAKFGERTADGKTIKLSQSDKWFKQAKVIEGKKITTTDTGIAFRKIAKNSPKISFSDWNKYLDEIAKTKKIEVNLIKGKLVDCGKPGLSGATKVAKSAAVDRLTDSTKYGGTHGNRFDKDGKGRGKEGRVDPKSDGYVSGYKNKGAHEKQK